MGIAMRWLTFRMKTQPTTCQNMDCENTLPRHPVDKHYCTQECSDQAWWDSFI